MKKTTFLTILTTVLFLWIGSTTLFAQATVENVSIIEGDAGTSNAVVTVTLPGAAAVGGTTVLYTITANTATEGTDYTVPGDRIVIPQGSTTGTISIPIIGDTTIEDLEDFSISVSTDLANDAGFDSAATFWSPLTGINVCTPAIQAVIGTAYAFETNPENTYSGNGNLTNQVLEVDCQSQGFQNIATVPTVTYTVKFKASRRTANGPGPNPSTVTVSALNAGTLAVDGTTTIQRTNTAFNLSESTFNFTASSTSTRIEFTTTNNQGLGMIFDDLSIIPQTADDTATITIVDETPGNVGADLALWLKADEDATAANWLDQSGNGNDGAQATAGNQPVVTTNSINFNPTVTFDGTNDYFDLPDNILATGDDAVGIYAVWSSNTTGTQRTVSFGPAGSNNAISQQLFTGNFGLQGEVANLAGHLQPYTVNTPTIATTFTQATATNDYEVGKNGSVFATVTVGASLRNLLTTDNKVGARFNNTEIFDGEIAEIVVYSEPQTSATERQQIESYLAIKYGITLNSGNTAYLASDGTTTVWPVDATYASDIFGIARDDDQALNQEISKSVNTGAVLTINTSGDFTSANDGSRTDLTDGQYLIVGSNGLATTAQTTEIDATGNVVEGILREWKAQNTATVAAVSLKFDGFTSEYVLIKKNASGDFSSGTTVVGRLDDNGEITNVALNNNDHFTLVKLEAPGAINAGLALWLKANDNGGITADGATLTSWVDQSGNALNAANTGTPTYENDAVNAMNFNPTIDFDGVGDYLTTAATDLATNFSYFLVLEQDATGNISFEHGGSNDFTSQAGGAVIFGSGFISYPQGGLTGIPLLRGVTATQSAASTIYDNGQTASFTAGGAANGAVVYSISASASGVTPLDGRIAEIIAYDANIASGNQVDRIQSYLAIKYGITLNNGLTAYLDAAGTIWPVDATYNSDIFGIARDDDQALDQQISKSVNTGAVLTLSSTNDFTTPNDGTRAILTDEQFLVIGNDGASGAIADAISTDLVTTTYYERSAREWKAVNTGTIAGAINLQFDCYNDTWVLLTRTTDGNFSAATGTTETAISTTGTVAIALPGTTYFTLARKATSIEFEAATANADENVGDMLPRLLIDGTLNEDTNIDIVLNAAGTATLGTDYTFGGNTATLPQTIAVSIPEGTYTAASPLALAGLDLGKVNQFDESYPIIRNDAADGGSIISEVETITAPFTGTYEVTYSGKTFTSSVSGGTANGFVRVGTTSGGSDIFGASVPGVDRISAATPVQKYTFTLTAGTQYFITSLGGGSSVIENVTTELNFLPGPVNFAITGDAIVEADETINLTLSNPQPGLVIQEVAGGALINNHIYTITNDDSITVEFSAAASASTDETAADNFGSILVLGQTATNLTFDVELVPTGSATITDDYTFTSPTTITVLANTVYDGTAGTALAIPGFSIVDDDIIEGNETVSFQLANAATGVTQGDVDGDTAFAPVYTYTITDDDELTVEFNNATYTSTDETGVITLTLDVSGAEITSAGSIQVDVTGGAATGGGTDYSFTDPTTVTIPIGDYTTPGTVTTDITIVTDAIIEGDETILLGLITPSTGVTVGTQATATATITDDDGLTVEFNNATYTSTDETGVITLTLDVSGAEITSAGSIQVDVTGGTATGGGTDYTFTDPTTVTIPIGDYTTPGTVTTDITIVTDAIIEGDETILLGLITPSTGVTVGTQATATATITDDDGLTVEFNNATYTSTDETGVITLTLDVSGAEITSAGSIQVDVTGGTATGGGTDYSFTDPTTVTIPIGDYTTPGTVTTDITIVTDAIIEGDETILLGLITPSTGVTVGTQATATATITDDDGLTVEFNNATYTSTDETGVITLTLDVSGAEITSAGSIQVDVTGGTATGGGTDYTFTDPTTVTIPIGDYTGGGTVTTDVTIVTDAIIEGDETIAVALINPSANTTVGTQATATATITDDDGLTVEFNNATYTSTDETGVITLTLDVSGAEITSAGSIQVDVTGGTATGGGTDYSFTDPTTVTIPIGDYTTPGTVTTDITIVTDAIIEGDETILLGLVNPSANTTVGTQATATATITDDDGLTVEFNNATYTSTDETGVITLTLDVSGAEITSAGSIQVDVTGGTATGGGTDYTFTDPTTVTIPIGDYTTPGTVTTDITIVTDAIIEGDETITLDLITPSTGVTVGTQATATATITDDDGLTVEFANATFISTNETGTLTIDLTVSGAEITTAESISIDDLLTGSATAGGTDYTFADPTVVNIPVADYTVVANQTISITITLNDDAIVEGIETIDLLLISPSANVTLGAQTTATGNITDDDSVIVQFGTAASADVEATGGNLPTLFINGTVANATTVTVTDAGTGSATGTGTDYNFTSPQVVTIPAGLYDGTAGTAIVIPALSIIDDAIVESGDETIDFILGTATGDATLGTTLATTYTITDDDIVDVTSTGTMISATDGTAVANGTETETITVQLKDAAGNDLTGAGVNVTFAVTGSAVLSATTAVTDANGTATITITSAVAETVDVTATIDDDNDGGTTPEVNILNGSPAQVSFTPDTPDPTNVNTTITATGPVPANGTDVSTVTVQLADSNGNLFTTGGETVTLNVSGNAILVSGVTDNGNGTYTATFSNLLIESVTITGTLNGSAITDNTTISFILDTTPGCTVNCDTDGDGDCDVNCDTDGDGDCDLNCDTDGDGDCDLNCDTDGDGDCDLNCDTDGDGDCDLNCDTDGDGDCDLNCDTDGDGDCDLNCDTDGDGDCDLDCDTDGDGTCDLNCDTDGDGDCDLNCDTDGDGDCDLNCDTDGDGDCDLNCDTDGDGDCDLNCDTDGGGDCDLNCDTDGDGDCDINCDTDGDGDCDLNCDTDGDGDCDLNCDTDGDGDPDVNIDTDGDGDCDLNCDTDGDGDCDLNCDTDGDGDPDVNIDTDGDGDCDLNCDTDGDGDCDINCDTDGDGDCDLNCDTDGDGDCDINCDTDGDGDPDVNIDTDGDDDCDLNCDTDDDGDCDINCDTDGDGDPDVNIDNDGDGDCDLNCDTNEDGDCDLNCDNDGDGTCDIYCEDDDQDGDGDGVPDIIECPDNPNCPDTDGDGTPDYLDTDDDNDGIDTINEVSGGSNPLDLDSDGDGIPNYRDAYDPNGDDDGDGVLNKDEDTDDDDNPYNNDCDGDGTPNFLDVKPCGITDIPKGFSPNGDGVNDTWVIPGIEAFPNHEIKLFNRWGTEVFSAVSYQNDWNGVSNGKRVLGSSGDRLPPGAYYYVIETGTNTVPPFTGWIYINY